eukprot:GEMP01028426.1.p1 GENE.GEMP01028426.1~~GEMP01028426.1.p1  ORF type:complete len:508 (+),score=78.17 GEMP01028426.1:113-1525(+)
MASMVGDIRGNIEKLKSQLRSLRYQLEEIDDDGLSAGKPSAVLPVLHYVFLGFSKYFTGFVEERGYDLHSKNDLRFVELVYKCLRNDLDYRPQITTAQFFLQGFAERKVIFLQDVVRLARTTHNDLCAKNPKTSISSAIVHTPVSQQPDVRSPASPPSPKQTMADTIRTMEERRASRPLHAPRFSVSTDDLIPNKPPKPAEYSPAARVATNDSFIATQESSTFLNEQANVCDGSAVASGDGDVRAIVAAVQESVHEQMEAGFQRMESLMKKFMQDVTSRMTVLEGELKILSSRIGEQNREFVSADLPNNSRGPLGLSTSPTSVPSKTTTTESKLYRGFSQPTSLSPELLNQPSGSSRGAASLGDRHGQDLRSGSSAKVSVPKPSGQHSGTGLPGAGIGSPTLIELGHLPLIGDDDTPTTVIQHSSLMREIAATVEEGTRSSAQETEMLISQLTEKFRDTQVLLDKARNSG